MSAAQNTYSRMGIVDAGVEQASRSYDAGPLSCQASKIYLSYLIVE